MAAASDVRIAKGEALALDGVPLGIKDLFCTEGVHSQAGEPHPRRVPAGLRVDCHRQPVGRRRGDARQAEHGRVRHGLVQRDVLLRPGGQSLAVDGLQCAAGAGRLVRRLGRGGRGAALCRRRPAPIPAARSASRPPSPARSASSRPTGAARAGGSSPSPRRSTRPGRSRARFATRRSCCARWRASMPKDTTSVDLPVPDYEAAVGQPVTGLRIGVPKEYRIEGMPAEIEALWEAGQGMAQRGRRRDRRHLAAAHQVRFAGLLYRRPGRGLVQSRPL